MLSLIELIPKIISGGLYIHANKLVEWVGKCQELELTLVRTIGQVVTPTSAGSVQI